MCKIFAIDMDGTLTKEICWTPEDCLNATPNKSGKESKQTFGKKLYRYLDGSQGQSDSRNSPMVKEARSSF